MKKHLLTSILLVFALGLPLILAITPAIALASEGAVKAEQIQCDNPVATIPQVANEIALNYHDMGWFAGNVLVTQNNKPIFAKSYGFSHLATNTKNNLQTRFNLGSIMKDLTRVLVAQFIQRGQLNLSDTLDKFELGFAATTAQKITIEHVLTHQAGFPDIFTAQYRENPLAFDSLEKKLNLLVNAPLLFEPGQGQQYSNYGYIVLGSILEKASAKTFEQLLVEHIFKPLNLTNVTLKVDATSPLQSQRYTFLYDNSLSPVGVAEHPSPDGGLEADIQSVQAFVRALFYSDKLLSRDSPAYKKLFTPTRGHWGSFGGGRGMSAAVEVDINNNVEIVVLANTDNLVAERISNRILSYLRTCDYTPIKPLAQNFLYQYYQVNTTENLYAQFKDAYAQRGYQHFIGRPINELGMQLLRTEKWTEALDIFAYLLHLFPNAPQAYDSLAFAYATMGQHHQAQRMFAKALALSPTFNSDYSSSNYGAH